ncbi:MAG: His/Gly/Thr/Pro-type tRNA ligase C-terminal domain-containing protein [Anaerolineae bacterium]
MGIERIIDVIEELGMYPPSLGRTTAQLLVTIFDESTRPASIQLCQELRRQDIHVELSFEVGKIGSQIRYASQKGIPFVAILGPDEVQAGKVTLRDMDKAQQVTVDRSAVVPLLRQWLAERQHVSDGSEQ